MKIKVFADLTKFGIVIFVLLTGLAGFALSFPVETQFTWQHFWNLMGGLYFLSSGSLALNQLQEYKMDQLMPRTAKRPIASGKIKPAAAAIIAAVFLAIGSDLLFKCSVAAGALGLLTVVLYNGFYTLWWKKKWIFAAIPGAIPGTLPVTIGYMANPSADILSLESMYLFGVLFLWQMPHFWALAIKFKDDYTAGGVPTLPVALGLEKTLFHMGVYTFAYVILAVAYPWFFVKASWFYLLFIIPMSFKMLQEFYRFYKSKGEQRWLAFFMWINISVLVYLFVPVIDKWNFLFINNN